jgi:putative redox protein
MPIASAPQRIELVLGKKYDSVITGHKHQWASDEPATLGGADSAPSPWELLLSSLASCTAITVRMYAERKLWALDEVRVVAEHTDTGDIRMEVDIVAPDLDDEARARLETIAHKCPVVRAVQGGIAIEKQVAFRSS